MLASASGLWPSIRDFVSANLTTLPVLASIASAIVAVLAAFVSIYVARRQIRAAVVSANRQAWINALRDDLSELFETLTWMFLLRRQGTFTEGEGVKVLPEKSARARMLTIRVQLRLNPEETPNQALLGLIGRLIHMTMNAEGENREDMEQVMQNAIAKSQEILKTEWKRVKSGR
jgi:hypothetical protein